MFDPRSESPKKNINKGKAVTQSCVFEELIRHLSYEGLIVTNFLKNTIMEILNLEIDKNVKSPNPKHLPHFLFPAGNNLSF